ncbi:hypothetical protein [Microvirga sp. VF16]|nr:hypothetical protein [Microvirga sp. VF16]QRM31132.1 hypothetical protein JO965_09115 [Microvirga sp. VF16]
MKKADYLQREGKPESRRIPVSVALLFILVSINIAATVALLASLPG